MITAALLEFDNPNFNFYKYIPEWQDVEAVRVNYLQMDHPILKQQPQKCKDVRVMGDNIRPWNQQQVRKYLDKYFADLKNKGVNPYCSNIHPLSTWVDRQFNDYHCDWEYTDEYIKDMFGNPLPVGVSHGEKFVLVNVERTNIWFYMKHKVRGCNDGMHGKNKPAKIVGDSFYNKDDELIFWYDEEQRQRLQQMYDDEYAEKYAWEQWEAVKDQLNEVSFIPIPYLVAMHMLEAVPPKRMEYSGRWLVGEAYSTSINGNGYTYLECRQVSKDTWEAKLTTVHEYDYGTKPLVIKDRETAVNVLLNEWECMRCYETFRALFLDDENKLVKIYEVTQRRETKVTSSTPEIIRMAIENGATKIITAHNHPNGNLLPSNADRETHHKRVTQFEAFKLKMVDNLILHDEGYYSHFECLKNKNANYYPYKN